MNNNGSIINECAKAQVESKKNKYKLNKIINYRMKLEYQKQISNLNDPKFYKKMKMKYNQ